MSRTNRNDALDKYLSKKGKSSKKSDINIIDENEDIPYEPEIDEEEEDGPVIVTENYIPVDDLNFKSDLDENNRRKKDSKSRRKRYDSDDSSSQKGELVRPSKRYHTDDSSLQREKRRRKRFDSDDEDTDHKSRKTNRRRYDSDDDISHDRPKPHKKARKRYDSDDNMRDNSPNRNDFDNENEKSKKKRQREDERAKMSSGHSAGLQSAAQFRVAENRIQGEKRQDMKELTPGSTVYRDKDGKVLVMSEPSQNTKANIENDGTWNVGLKQRQDAIERATEMQIISQSTFARSVNDTDRFMRNVAREGDPMASHASQSEHGGKKIYKGPPAKPNRFNIRPGYRWDGVDRGNGFEDKVLAKIYGKGNRDEERYKYSCADM